ncbi:hypothetical protein B0T13DRAFT_73355 [Neurospora crassa]|nr:hypothetical protein B0T13DRAFT_73355 [Neurospora crassa]
MRWRLQNAWGTNGLAVLAFRSGVGNSIELKAFLGACGLPSICRLRGAVPNIMSSPCSTSTTTSWTVQSDSSCFAFTGSTFGPSSTSNVVQYVLALVCYVTGAREVTKRAKLSEAVTSRPARSSQTMDIDIPPYAS